MRLPISQLPAYDSVRQWGRAPERNTVNKSQLIQAVSEEADVSKSQAKSFVEAFERVVVSTVQAGEAITLTGFCKFARKDIAARPRRRGRNPFTGEEQWFEARPASKGVRITALKSFKDTVARGKAKRR
jgi:nucleoid DNA-binding protein